MEYRHPKAIWKDPASLITDFGRVFFIGVFIIGAVLQWHAAQWAWSWSAFTAQAHISFMWWLVGGVVLTLASLLPPTIRPIYFLWILLGQTLGLVVNYLLLGVVFYLIFTPLGLLYRRWCGVITKRPDPKLASYWEEKQSQGERDRYYRQF